MLKRAAGCESGTDDAIRHWPSDVQERWPPADVVHRIHDRYLEEIVEGLNLCPFARRSRELGRVHRPLFWVDENTPTANEVADVLTNVHARHPDAEIVLLTFVVAERHEWQQPSAFEAMVRDLRETHTRSRQPQFYMVAFHPANVMPSSVALTRDTLVPLLRRSPDPVVQCVNIDVLDAVRRDAAATARARMLRAAERADPMLRTLLEHSVAADSELSEDIARHNFSAVGNEPGLIELERRIAAILEDRRRCYVSRLPSPS